MTCAAAPLHMQAAQLWCSNRLHVKQTSRASKTSPEENAAWSWIRGQFKCHNSMCKILISSKLLQRSSCNPAPVASGVQTTCESASARPDVHGDFQSSSSADATLESKVLPFARSLRLLRFHPTGARGLPTGLKKGGGGGGGGWRGDLLGHLLLGHHFQTSVRGTDWEVLGLAVLSLPLGGRSSVPEAAVAVPVPACHSTLRPRADVLARPCNPFLEYTLDSCKTQKRCR